MAPNPPKSWTGLQAHDGPSAQSLRRRITSRAAALAAAAACRTSELASPRCPMTCLTAEGPRTQFPSCHSPWADEALAGTRSLRASHSMATRASFEGQAPAWQYHTSKQSHCQQCTLCFFQSREAQQVMSKSDSTRACLDGNRVAACQPQHGYDGIV